MDYTIEEQMSVLRARVEAKIAPPGIIVVSSAARGDGKSLVASGIAESFASAGYRAALVDASNANLALHVESNEGWSRDSSHAADIVRYSATADRTRLVRMAFAGEPGKQISISQLVSVAKSLRAVYDFAVVDTTRLQQNAVALLFAAVADGVLLTLREGRREIAEDRKTITALKCMDATVLGIVSIKSSAIEDFARRTVSVPSPAKVRFTTVPADAAPMQPAATTASVS
jgi:protein-tyrosine kinase